MHNIMPPLKTLPAFIAVCNEQSVSKAADTLNVTHSAISQSIKNLEQHLGQALFTRQNNKLKLTQKGEIYYKEIANALNIIQSATTSLQKVDTFLTINLPPTLALRWMIPRISSFQNYAPEINLKISTLEKKIADSDFINNQIDIAIDYGVPKDWPNCFCHKLFNDALILVTGTDLAIKNKHTNLQKIINSNKCIYVSAPRKADDWDKWCQAAKVIPPKQNKRLYFQNTIQALSAAHKGLGILVARKPLLADDLDSKRLTQLSTIEIIPPNEYYLICPKSNLHNNKVKTFTDWLSTQETNKTI